MADVLALPLPSASQGYERQGWFWGSEATDQIQPVSLLGWVLEIGERMAQTNRFVGAATDVVPAATTVSRKDALPPWFASAVSRIEAIRQLRADDPDEVPLPDPKALMRVWSEADRFMIDEAPTPSILPTEDEGIMFVWHHGEWDLEVEVRAEETVVWGKTQDGGRLLRGSLDGYLPEVRKILEELK
jgi:hypothetical protein